MDNGELYIVPDTKYGRLIVPGTKDCSLIVLGTNTMPRHPSVSFSVFVYERIYMSVVAIVHTFFCAMHMLQFTCLTSNVKSVTKFIDPTLWYEIDKMFSIK